MKINFPAINFSFFKRNIKTISAVVGLYLFFLIINFPASVILSNIILPANITIASVAGTVWSGSIERLKVSSLDVGSVRWELNPLSLVIGELSADVFIVNNKQYINSEVNISPSGKVKLEETSFSIDLSSLAPLTYGMPFSYSGKASGYFPVSFFHKNNYVGINGKLSLAKIKMISPQQQSFGDFVIDFRAENQGATSGKITDSGGELKVDGQLNLTKKGMASISAKLAAREVGGTLENVLSFLGQKDASGRVQLNSSVKLWY